MVVDKVYLIRFLEAVIAGYQVSVVDAHNGKDWMVAVKNPVYEETVGNDPYLVLRVRKNG